MTLIFPKSVTIDIPTDQLLLTSKKPNHNVKMIKKESVFKKIQTILLLMLNELQDKQNCAGDAAIFEQN